MSKLRTTLELLATPVINEIPGSFLYWIGKEHSYMRKSRELSDEVEEYDGFTKAVHWGVAVACEAITFAPYIQGVESFEVSNPIVYYAILRQFGGGLFSMNSWRERFQLNKIRKNPLEGKNV